MRNKRTTLNLNIWEIRLILDESQKDFARGLGISSSYVSQLEYRTKNPSVLLYKSLIGHVREVYERKALSPEVCKKINDWFYRAKKCNEHILGVAKNT